MAKINRTSAPKVKERKVALAKGKPGVVAHPEEDHLSLPEHSVIADPRAIHQQNHQRNHKTPGKFSLNGD